MLFERLPHEEDLPVRLPTRKSTKPVWLNQSFCRGGRASLRTLAKIFSEKPL